MKMIKIARFAILKIQHKQNVNNLFYCISLAFINKISELVNKLFKVKIVMF